LGEESKNDALNAIKDSEIEEDFAQKKKKEDSNN